MEITGKVIWQHAVGDTDRNYSEICLSWDVILNGPGYAGAWPDCAQLLRTDGWTARKVTDLRRFSEEIADGDLIVLRVGTATVYAVGQVVGPYFWSDEFGDIDGWDLQHARRVRWLWMSIENPKTFDTYALKLGDTTQKLSEGPVMEWLSTLEIPDGKWKRQLVELPTNTNNDTTVSEISDFLFNHGVASASISNLLNEIGELIRIAKWYQRSSEPSEHETVAYLVTPLLHALGWTPQKMAIEWNRVDVALFDQLPRCDENLRIVVEAKKMDNSCLTAMSQAMSYSHGKSGCNRLIVTDGLRYGVYTRNVHGYFKLYAYLNLTRLMHKYPVYECEGAEMSLLAMTPEWRSESSIETS